MPFPPLDTLDRRLSDRVVRLVGLAIAAVLLSGAVAVSGHHGSVARPTEVLRLSDQVLPQVLLPKQLHEAEAPAQTRTTAKASKKKPAAKRAKTKAAPVRRWLPSGTGMWLHDFDDAQGGNAKAIVARAEAGGLTHLFVQTGSSVKGSIGDPALRALLPATKGTGIHVIAWDFPTLKNPIADARRLASAALFHCAGCPAVAAVAPDVETASEGTKINASNVIVYYNELRKRLPADIAILATVPWPSELRVGRYPYKETAARADAMLPMTYWYNRTPATVTAQTMTYLAQFHKPVMPIGQGYDGRIDAPYVKVDVHPYLSVRSFLLTARKYGATAVSLWSWDTSGAQQWQALVKAKPLYPLLHD